MAIVYSALGERGNDTRPTIQARAGISAAISLRINSLDGDYANVLFLGPRALAAICLIAPR